MVDGRPRCIPDRLDGGQRLTTAALYCARTALKPVSARSELEGLGVAVKNSLRVHSMAVDAALTA